MDTERKNQVQTAEDKTAGNETAGNGEIKCETIEKETMGDVVVRDKTKQKKQLIAGIGAALVLLVAVIAGLTIFGGSERKLQEQLDLGTKYLEEMDYEQALVAFNAALAIEPKDVDAYLGIVEVYIRTNEFELALKTAKEGHEVTGDERLKEKIDMIESGDIFASNGWAMKMSGYDGEGNLVFWHENTYNLKGQQASVAKYNAQGVQEQYIEIAYDEEGKRLVNYMTTLPEGNLSKCEIEYSGNNYRETWYSYLNDEVTSYKDVEVDSDGKVLKKTNYDATDGNIWEIEVNEYDEEGKMIKTVWYYPSNDISNYNIYIYDKDGKRSQTQFYGQDNKYNGYVEYIYDEEGKCIGDRWYNADGSLEYDIVNQ